MKLSFSSFFSKPSFLFISGFLCFVFFLSLGCADRTPPKRKIETTPSKFGYGGTNTDTSFVTNDSSSTNAATTPITGVSSPTTDTNPPSNPFLAPTPTPAVVSHDLPYGTPVPGKQGFVTSPHSPNAGYVDVRGFPPGTEVKDPYSGKVFLVP